MTRLTLCLCAVVLSMLLEPTSAGAARHTPLAWQQEVIANPRPHFVGQRKHTTWIRDKNRNFIDDLVDSMFTARDSVDIVVDFNECTQPEQIQTLLAPYGRLTYIAKLISCAYVEGVAVARLDSLAARREVAMIEWQTPSVTLNDVATRAIQARSSPDYLGKSAEEIPPSGVTGRNVRIAVLDTGVKDSHIAFTGAFVKGFDATIFEDGDGDNIDDSCGGSILGCTDPDDEAGSGTTNPEPVYAADHGTAVAGIALGRAGPAGSSCRTPTGITGDCVGTAPDAMLVDVKVCTENKLCADQDLMEGIDWIGLNLSSLQVQVANISIGDCADNDGTSAESEAVNYLAALGVVPVVGHGNADLCSKAPGTALTGSPGSASFAITVAAVNDQRSVLRGTDSHYDQYLTGPRKQAPSVGATPLANKPDLCAPGQDVMTAASATSGVNKYFAQKGTSFATAYVSGAVAIIREAKPSIPPGSVKSLLILKADRGLDGYATGATWDPAYGAGEVNVYDAVTAIPTTDVKFPNCVGPPSSAGGPCQLTSPLDSWNNYLDLRTDSPPQPKVANRIYADVENPGGAPASVIVNFGVYKFVGYTPVFQDLGSRTNTIAAGGTWTADQYWMPSDEEHQCIQVSIDFGLDIDFGNNVTQRNLQVTASRYEVRVENPFPVPTDFEVVAAPTRDGWPCRLEATRFRIDPFQECGRTVRVTFDPPPGAKAGDSEDCRITVRAKPPGAERAIVLGGVTARTVVPSPCKLEGHVVSPNGQPVPGARISIRQVGETDTSRSGEQGPRTVTADPKGVFRTELLSYLPYEISMDAGHAGAGTMRFKWWCGKAPLVFELGTGSLRVIGTNGPRSSR